MLAQGNQATTVTYKFGCPLLKKRCRLKDNENHSILGYHSEPSGEAEVWCVVSLWKWSHNSGCTDVCSLTTLTAFCCRSSPRSHFNNCGPWLAIKSIRLKAEADRSVRSWLHKYTSNLGLVSVRHKPYSLPWGVTVGENNPRSLSPRDCGFQKIPETQKELVNCMDWLRTFRRISSGRRDFPKS